MVVDISPPQTKIGAAANIPVTHSITPFGGSKEDTKVELPSFLKNSEFDTKMSIGDFLRMTHINRVSSRLADRKIIYASRVAQIRERLNGIFKKRELPSPWDCLLAARLKHSTFNVTQKDLHSLLDNGFTPKFEKVINFHELFRLVFNGYGRIIDNYYGSYTELISSLLDVSRRPRAMQLLLAPSPVDLTPQGCDSIAKILDRKNSPPHLVNLTMYHGLLIRFHTELLDAWSRERVLGQKIKQDKRTFLGILRAWERLQTLILQEKLSWKPTVLHTQNLCNEFVQLLTEEIRRLHLYGDRGSYQLHPDTNEVCTLSHPLIPHSSQM